MSGSDGDRSARLPGAELVLALDVEVRDAGPLWLVSGWLETWGGVEPNAVGSLVLWVLDQAQAAGIDPSAVVRWVLEARKGRRSGGAGGPTRQTARPVRWRPSGGAA